MNSAVILIAIAEILVAIMVLNLNNRLHAVRKELLAESIKRSKELYEYQERDIVRWLQLKNDVSNCQRDCGRLQRQMDRIDPNVGNYTRGGEKE